MIRALLLAAWLSAWAGGALAHKASDSYYRLDVQGETVTGQLDLALRDLDFALGLDADGDGQITWGEVRARHPEIAAYALARLSLAADGAPCTLAAGRQLVDDHTDGAYTVLEFGAQCPVAPRSLTLGYTLFGELDPQHRGLLRLDAAGSARTAIFSPEVPSQRFELRAPSRWYGLQFRVREAIFAQLLQCWNR